jgi:hypothetical protein
MLDADRARFIHGGHLILPSEEQVIIYAGSWLAALSLAGLEETDESEGRAAPSLVALMERFHEHYATRPMLTHLEVFASGNGIPFPSRRQQHFGEALDAWKAKRSAEGLPEPAKSPPTRERPDYSRDVGAALPGERRQAKRRGAEECVAWMRRYLEGLPVGARSTLRSYSDWTKEREGAPSASSFSRHGGFAHVRSLAQEQMRAEASG